MLSLRSWLYLILSTLMVAAGCTGRPGPVEAPDVDPADAVSAALQAYDANGDKALSGDELAQVPAIATFLPEYDKDGDKSVSEAELTQRFERLFAVAGFSKVNCLVLFNGRPLSGAEVTFEPEPFLGNGFKTARGTTGAQGSTQIAVPNDQLPEANQRLGGGVYNGLYKVSITHPSTKLPEAYQGDATVLGHEVSSMTSAGADARFRLDSKGTKPY
jgi:hypothetical protein